MAFEIQRTIPPYREVATINQAHKITLVQHPETKKVYVKKILDVYNPDVYRQLRQSPVPGIPQIYDLLETDGRLIVIEEYVSGQTLQECLDSQGTLSEDLAAGYLCQLCDILSSLHNLKPAIIHRDIKPSNIMITPAGQVILLDLNAAKYMDPHKTTDTKLLGTAGFAAPEQYGFGSSTIQTDIYAAGVLLNTLLTGELPNQRMAKGKFQSVIRKCTQLEPDSRYKTIDELRRAIEKICPNDVKTGNSGPARTHDFLPPGFRTGTTLHMLVAIPIYVLVFYFGLTLDAVDATGMALTAERIIFLLAMLAIIFFSCDYRHVQRLLPLCYSKNGFIRLVIIFVYDVLILFVGILLIMAAESLLSA